MARSIDTATIIRNGTGSTIDSDLIGDGVITAAKLSDNSVTAAKLSDNSVTAEKLNVGQIGGRRNLIINGAMKVSQRGTTISGGTGRDSYGLDRFVFEGTDYPITTQVAHSNSQITDGNRNALKISTAGTAGLGSAQVHQRIERETFRHTIGQTVTFSCLVKRNSSNVTGGTFRMIASVNQNATYVFRDNPSTYPSHTVTETFVSGVQNIPTDYTRYTASFTMPAGANTTDILEIGLSFINFTGAPAWEDLFSISEMQLELGDTATPFEHRSYGEELALCQRYYTEVTTKPAAGGYLLGVASGMAWNASSVSGMHIMFPVEMRSAPTLTTSFGGTPGVYSPYRGFSSGTIFLNGASSKAVSLGLSGSSGLIVSEQYYLYSSGTNFSSLKFKAEL